MPVRTYTRKHTHTQYIVSCPIILCSIILPCPRQIAHFSAFLLYHSIVYATQYHRSCKSLAQYITIHLKLSDSQLQYYVHSSLSMNQFPGIYRGIGAALVNFCYNSKQSHSPHFWSLTYDHEKHKDWPRQTAVMMCSLLRLFQYLRPSRSLTFDSHFGMSLPFSRKRVACKQVCPKTSFWTKEHQRTSTTKMRKRI
jgi:hypothetical protein